MSCASAPSFSTKSCTGIDAAAVDHPLCADVVDLHHVGQVATGQAGVQLIDRVVVVGLLDRLDVILRLALLNLFTTCCTTPPLNPVRPYQKVKLVAPAGMGTVGKAVAVGAGGAAVGVVPADVAAVLVGAAIAFVAVGAAITSVAVASTIAVGSTAAAVVAVGAATGVAVGSAPQAASIPASIKLTTDTDIPFLHLSRVLI